jgi:hypothetical protein
MNTDTRRNARHEHYDRHTITARTNTFSDSACTHTRPDHDVVYSNRFCAKNSGTRAGNHDGERSFHEKPNRTRVLTGADLDAKTKLGARANCRTKQAPKRGHTKARTRALTRSEHPPSGEHEARRKYDDRQEDPLWMNKLKEKSEPGARTKTTSRKKSIHSRAHTVAAKQKLRARRKTNSLPGVHCGSKTKTASTKKNGSTGTACLDPQQSPKHEWHNQDAKYNFFIEIHTKFLQSHSSSPSLPHLIIRIKIESLTHFNSRKYKNKIRKRQVTSYTL